MATITNNAIPRAVYLQVHTALNSDGTDQVQLGVSGSLGQWFPNQDVSTSGVKLNWTAPTVQGQRSTESDLIITITCSGSAPTAGDFTVFAVWEEGIISI